MERFITKEELILVLETFLQEIKNDESLVSFHRSFRTFDVGEKVIGTEIFYLGTKFQKPFFLSDNLT